MQFAVRGQNSCNRLGIYDLSGNVYEWCYDLYADLIPTGTFTNPTGPDSSETSRVIRGGSWGAYHFRRAFFSSLFPRLPMLKLLYSQNKNLINTKEMFYYEKMFYWFTYSIIACRYDRM